MSELPPSSEHVAREQPTWQVADGTSLQADWWPVEHPRALILITHGWGEHRGRYSEWIPRLVDRRYSVFSYDLRGHGRSSGQRGYAPSYDSFLDDLDSSLRRARSLQPATPIVLYGHSFGGLVTLSFMLQRANQLESDGDIAGGIITSPLLGLSMPVPIWKLWLAKSVGRWLPRLTVRAGIDISKLSHDDRVREELLADPYRHGRISAPVFLGITRAAEQAQRRAAELAQPVLLMHGAADPITDPQASRLFADRAGERVDFRLWPEMFHELHHETLKAQVLKNVMKWLDKVLADFHHGYNDGKIESNRNPVIEK